MVHPSKPRIAFKVTIKGPQNPRKQDDTVKAYKKLVKKIQGQGESIVLTNQRLQFERRLRKYNMDPAKVL